MIAKTAIFLFAIAAFSHLDVKLPKPGHVTSLVVGPNFRGCNFCACPAFGAWA